LLRRHPDAAWRFFNRGVGGDRIPELHARWAEDTIALKPDVLTVLVGVNDFWHTKMGRYAGTTADFESGYVSLLEQTRRALPSVRVMVLEPFVLPVGFVDDSWFPGFDERRAAAKRVAGRMGATFVPLQAQFDALAVRTGPAYWAADGVHPTPAGHEVIADQLVALLGD
jgi:lysophospholipase L1-like esterase